MTCRYAYIYVRAHQVNLVSTSGTHMRRSHVSRNPCTAPWPTYYTTTKSIDITKLPRATQIWLDHWMTSQNISNSGLQNRSRHLKMIHKHKKSKTHTSTEMPHIIQGPLPGWSIQTRVQKSKLLANFQPSSIKIHNTIQALLQSEPLQSTSVLEYLKA